MNVTERIQITAAAHAVADAIRTEALIPIDEARCAMSVDGAADLIAAALRSYGAKVARECERRVKETSVLSNFDAQVAACGDVAAELEGEPRG